MWAACRGAGSHVRCLVVCPHLAVCQLCSFCIELFLLHLRPPCLSYSPRQMFDVVADVEQYHLFVPWCVRSSVKLRRPPSYMEAELEVGFQMFVER